MAAKMREATCAAPLTSKVPTEVGLLFLSLFCAFAINKVSPILQRLQNRAVRIITKCGYDCRSVDILNDLELPNLSVRRNHQLCTIMYQLNNGMVPDYLIDLFTKINVVHGYGTRQVEFNFMPPKPRTNLVKNPFHTEAQWPGIV